jgi:glycosyltransferase involved in cell wall biosynthesis
VSILFLSPTGQIGGAEAALHEMLAGLRDAHPSWSLHLVVASEGPLVERVRKLGVSVEVLAFPPALAALGDWGTGADLWSTLKLFARCAAAIAPAFSYWRRLGRLLRRRRPTVIHSNGLKMHVLAAWAKPRRTPVVWHFHDFAGRRSLMSRLLKRSMRRCSAIVTNSRSVADDARSVCGHALPIHSVWNAVDLGRFSPDGPRLDLDTLAKLPPPGKSLVRVGLVATFARWKGHETFLEALSLVPATIPIRGYIVGGPIYETSGSQVAIADLRERAESLGLGSRVGFTGFVADASSAIRSLDIVVHASTDPEPFGLVIAEAMACGKPVVASRAGGAIELTDACEHAMTHMPGDAAGLAKRIEELATDPGLRAHLGTSGRAAAERCFTRSRMAFELTPIYQELAHVH